MLVPVLISELRAAASDEPPVIPKSASWVLGILILVAYVSGGIKIAVQYEDIRPRRIGDPAPGFVLPRLDGKGDVSLAGLSGKPVVLDFWATWCAPCIKGMPKLVSFAKAHPEVAVLAIHVGGDNAEVQAMIRDNKWTAVTYLLDEASRTSLLYQADTLPKYVIVDPTGHITAYRYGVPPAEWFEKAIE
jgi:thiol-disulfide isomerase/thioredoxin